MQKIVDASAYKDKTNIDILLSRLYLRFSPGYILRNRITNLCGALADFGTPAPFLLIMFSQALIIIALVVKECR